MISILESNQIWTELHKTSHEISIIIQNNGPERISFKFGDDENWDDGRERRHLTWPQFKWCSNVGTELWDYYCSECEVKDLLLLTHFLICFLQDSLCLFWGRRFFAVRVKEIVEIKQREIRRYISLKGQEIFRV